MTMIETTRELQTRYIDGMKTAQEQVAAGTLPVEYAFRLLTITKSIERIADHCTNICEQVIYLHAGLIVRHRPEGWSKPLPPTQS